MRKTSTPFVDEEISKLKLKLEGRDHHHPEVRENVVPPNLIDSPLDQPNLKDERIFRLASESAAEEAELELNSLLEEFRDWKKKHKGTFKDFLKDNREKIKVIQISKNLTDRKFAHATETQQEEADRLWKLELKKMELDPYYIPEIIDPEEVSLGGGGRVVDLAKYRKSKQPKIKEIKLGDYFDLGRTMASLSQHEKETLSWLLNKSFPKKD